MRGWQNEEMMHAWEVNKRSGGGEMSAGESGMRSRVYLFAQGEVKSRGWEGKKGAGGKRERPREPRVPTGRASPPSSRSLPFYSTDVRILPLLQ